MAFSHDDMLDTRILADELRDLISEADDAHEDGDQDIVLDLRAEIAEYVAIAVTLANPGTGTFTPDDAADALDSFDGPLISEGYFQTYAQDYAEDIGAVDRNAAWPNSYIDWEAAANALASDFTTYEIDGQTYYANQ